MGNSIKAAQAAFFYGAALHGRARMQGDVQVLPYVDHDGRSEAQLHESDRMWGGSGNRKS